MDSNRQILNHMPFALKSAAALALVTASALVLATATAASG